MTGVTGSSPCTCTLYRRAKKGRKEKRGRDKGGGRERENGEKEEKGEGEGRKSAPYTLTRSFAIVSLFCTYIYWTISGR